MAMLSANRRSPSLSPTSTRSLTEVTRSESLDSEGREDSLDSSKGEPEEQDKISSKEKNANGVLEKDVCEVSSLEESFEATIKLEEEKTEKQRDPEPLDSLESVNHQDIISTIHEEEEPQNIEEEKPVKSERNIKESEVDLEVKEIHDADKETVHDIKADAIKRVHYDVSPVEDDQIDEAVNFEMVKEEYPKTVEKHSLDIKKFHINEPNKNGKVDYQGLYQKEINKTTDLKASKDVAFDHDSPKRGFRTFNTQFGGLLRLLRWFNYNNF